jgi:endonuclease/exonuclease/phosphatase family metal-dependent hydrolase
MLTPTAMSFAPTSPPAAPFALHSEFRPAAPYAVQPAPFRSDVSAGLDGSSSARAFSPADIKVMSFNLRVPFFLDTINYWPFRKSLTAETIRDYAPDLLGTQECLNEQAIFLRDQLPDYQFIGAGRDDGRLKGEMTACFFKTSKFDEISHGFFWLSQTPWRPGSKSWGSAYPRMCTWVKLRPKNGGPAFCWFNTHFDNLGSRARLESSKLLRDQIISLAGNMPVVITGDFNTDEHTAPYRQLLKVRPGIDQVLVDTFRAVNPTDKDDCSMHNFHGGTRGSRIDWIMTTNTFQPVAAGIDHEHDGLRYPSDHYPVTATLRPALAPTLAQAD